MMRRLMLFGVAVTAAAVFGSIGAARANSEPVPGWWSGTIEIASDADRTYKYRFDDEPPSNDIVSGSSSHTLQYQIEFEPTFGWSDMFRFSVPEGEPNARLSYYSWSATGFAQDPTDCTFTSSGTLSGPISTPIAFNGFRNVTFPLWEYGSAPPRGQLSLSPLGSCEARPTFGIAEFPNGEVRFRDPDPFDEILFRRADDDSNGTVRHLRLCAERFDDEGVAPVADLITTTADGLAIDASGVERCDGTYFYDFGDSTFTQEDVATVSYDIDASFTPSPTIPGFGPDPGPELPEPKADEQTERRRAGPHLGMVCGRAKFDFHALNAESDRDFVDEGETACMVALSNALTLELGDGGLVATDAILRRFGHVFLGALVGKAAEAIVKKATKMAGESILKAIVPGLKKAAGKVNPMVNAGKALALAIVPYAAATHLKHLRKYKGCTRILIAVDGGKLRMGGGLLYSPRGLNDPGDDRELTRASVWRQTKRRFARDDWDRMSSGLTCAGNGQIGLSSRDNKIFSKATYSLLHG